MEIESPVLRVLHAIDAKTDELLDKYATYTSIDQDISILYDHLDSLYMIANSSRLYHSILLNHNYDRNVDAIIANIILNEYIVPDCYENGIVIWSPSVALPQLLDLSFDDNGLGVYRINRKEVDGDTFYTKLRAGGNTSRYASDIYKAYVELNKMAKKGVE